MAEAWDQHRLAEGQHALPEGRRAEAAWYAWSIQYRWAERAAAYDEQHIDRHSKLATQKVIQLIHALAEKGIAAIEAEKPLFAPWREHLELLQALAALVSENDPRPVAAARTYNDLAPPLRNGGPGRPREPGTADS
jgi:hypothetical protein